MPNMHCSSIGGMKNQHDAILDSFGTTAQLKRSFIRSLAYRQQLNLFFPLLSSILKNLKLSSSLYSSQSWKLF